VSSIWLFHLRIEDGLKEPIVDSYTLQPRGSLASTGVHVVCEGLSTVNCSHFQIATVFLSQSRIVCRHSSSAFYRVVAVVSFEFLSYV
jgi:hypothetical protein